MNVTTVKDSRAYAFMLATRSQARAATRFHECVAAERRVAALLYNAA